MPAPPPPTQTSASEDKAEIARLRSEIEALYSQSDSLSDELMRLRTDNEVLQKRSQVLAPLAVRAETLDRDKAEAAKRAATEAARATDALDQIASLEGKLARAKLETAQLHEALMAKQVAVEHLRGEKIELERQLAGKPGSSMSGGRNDNASARHEAEVRLLKQRIEELESGGAAGGAGMSAGSIPSRQRLTIAMAAVGIVAIGAMGGYLVGNSGGAPPPPVAPPPVAAHQPAPPPPPPRPAPPVPPASAAPSPAVEAAADEPPAPTRPTTATGEAPRVATAGRARPLGAPAGDRAPADRERPPAPAADDGDKARGTKAPDKAADDDMPAADDDSDVAKKKRRRHEATPSLIEEL